MAKIEHLESGTIIEIQTDKETIDNIKELTKKNSINPKKNLKIDTIELIHIYPIICKILNIEPNLNIDGNINVLKNTIN